MTHYDGPPLKLRKVKIKNVRCFKELSLDLSSPRGTRSWGVIFGDNGVGKTTLLRSIAMGMCDAASAAGLLREIYGEWNRREGSEVLESEIYLEFDSKVGKASITTKIVPTKSGYSQIAQSTKFAGSSKDFPWDSIFACGYGAARRSFGTRDIEGYSTIDAVYTLFNYDTPLQNPELVIRRLADAPGITNRNKKLAKKRDKAIDDLLDSLSAILMLPEGSIRLTGSGLLIAGPWGNFQPVGGLGDGYQATLSWITDFLGWALLYDPNESLEKVQGIVLIDEIEQHLHPRWQSQIVKLLHDQFPAVQFLATTHTPMCAVGTTDLADDDCELIKLERGEDAVEALEDIRPPRGKRADQILTSLLFELPSSGDNQTKRDIARFNQLKSQSATKVRRAELEHLTAKLRNQFDEGESDFETAIRIEVRKALRSHRERNVNLEAADFEILRQLRELNQ